MEERILHIPVRVKREQELDESELRLLAEAKAATLRSYSPYSHFAVGAAALLDDGTVVSGSNQENCAYPSGLCAERTAVFYANSRYPGRAVRLLCVAARDASGELTKRPVAPCGACRQVLLEAEARAGVPMGVMLYGTEGACFVASVRDLLPLSFDESYLGCGEQPDHPNTP